ncbi:SNF2 family N-terminal domain-containing protein [Aspergillus varians]
MPLGVEYHCKSRHGFSSHSTQPPSPTPTGRGQSNRSTATKDDMFSTIWKTRRIFLAHIKDVICPLLGDKADIFDCPSGAENAHDTQIRPYVLLDAQPVGLRATLKPYQLEGLSWLLYLRNNGIGGILADDMGLGKTLQTLSLFQYLIDSEPTDDKFLVVCPLSVLSTWISEISKWTTGLMPLAYHGSSEDRENLRRLFRQQEGKSVNLVVTSYETLCNDLWFFQKTVWSYVVLDEGHRIKNSKSKRSQGIYRLRAQYELVLTGTPIQNDLTELWSILHWLYPEAFVPTTSEQFKDAFSLKKGKFDSMFLANVTHFLKLVMLRRTKASPEIGINIPPKKETILSVPLTEFQLGWYRKILTGVDKSVLLGEDSHQFQPQSSLTPILERYGDLTTDEWEARGPNDTKRRSRITTNTLMELRKCSIHPYLLVDALPDPYYIGRHVVENSGKFIVLQKMVHQFVIIEKKKVIIFSGFDQALNLCEDLFEMEKIYSPFEHVRLDGSTSAAWRNLSVYLFQNDPRYMVFLVSIRAGGEGLNLVSSSTVIFLDDDWNPQVMRQAESRVHRIGQTRPVSIFRIHARGTVEDQMRRRLSKKAYLADKVIENLEHDVYHPIDLEDSAEQEISLIPSKAIVPKSFDATKLAGSDFGDILNSCALDEISVQEMSFAEKKAWLERAERVKTDIFNGERVDTSSKQFSVYDETILGVSRASRRIGKSRVVVVGEWEVSRESIVSASTPTSPTFPTHKADTKALKVNETVCFICHRRKPLECESCTRSFHSRCLDREDDLDYNPKGSTIVCPHHYCFVCGKTASEAGRLLFSCLKCPRAYCENCLEWSDTRFVGKNPEAESRGYSPKNAFFIECIVCKGVAEKRCSEAKQVESTKRARRR